MTRPARGLASVLGVLLLGFALIGCGDAASGDEDRPDGTTTTESTTTTQPPATDAAAVRPVIEDLVAEFDDALAEVLVEPAQVQDPESPARVQLEAVFTAEHLESRLATFEQNAAEGTVFTPLDGEPLRVTTLTGEVEPSGDDSLQVMVCTTYHYRKNSPTGGEERRGLSHPGIVYAEREDGVWKVSRTDEDPNQLCDPETEAAA